MEILDLIKKCKLCCGNSLTDFQQVLHEEEKITTNIMGTRFENIDFVLLTKKIHSFLPTGHETKVIIESVMLSFSVTNPKYDAYNVLVFDQLCRSGKVASKKHQHEKFK